MTANATARPLNPQRDVFNQRLPLVIVIMVIVSGALLLRMLSFQQLAPEVLNELRPDYDREVRLAAARGLVYDHNGQRLAVNTLEYRIGVSPNLVSDPPRTARLLATILGIDELEVFRAVTSTAVWELLASRVPAEIGQQVEQLKNDGQLLAVTIEKIPRRSYPQMCAAATHRGRSAHSYSVLWAAISKATTALKVAFRIRLRGGHGRKSSAIFLLLCRMIPSRIVAQIFT